MIEFLQQFWTIVNHGGVLMIALLLLATGLYWLVFDTLANLPASLGESNMQKLKSSSDIQLYRLDIIDYFKGRKKLLQSLTTVAPLLGLLGTVMGMLATFKGKAVSDGNTVDLIAAGISQAMITTETGLIVAIPAALFVMHIGSRIEAMETMLSKRQSLLMMSGVN